MCRLERGLGKPIHVPALGGASDHAVLRCIAEDDHEQKVADTQRPHVAPQDEKRRTMKRNQYNSVPRSISPSGDTVKEKVPARSKSNVH